MDPTPRESNPVTNYFHHLKVVLTRPTDFFRDLKRPTGIAGPLFFGIVTSWIGSALEYLWYAGFGRVFGSRISDIFTAMDKSAKIDSSGDVETALALRQKLTDWVFGVGAVLIDPFKTFAWILFLSLFIWVAARLFSTPVVNDPERRWSYESAVAIAAFAQAATLFKAVPLVGGLIGIVFGTVIAVIGASETYRVSTGRGILIALFPTLLFWGVLIAGTLAFFAALLMFFFR